jgi:hypothetical protein
MWIDETMSTAAQFRARRSPSPPSVTLSASEGSPREAQSDAVGRLGCPVHIGLRPIALRAGMFRFAQHDEERFVAASVDLSEQLLSVSALQIQLSRLANGNVPQ